MPLLASDYLLRAILIPFLILSLAALGLNILVGYCGQISLGTGAFMAVGAYAAYNFQVRIDGMPLLAVAAARRRLRARWSAWCSAFRRCASRACTWRWRRWRRSSSSTGRSCASSGSPTTRRRARCRCPDLNVFGLPIDTPVQKYLFCLAFVAVFALLAKNLVRGHIGREWMAIRDMDVAAAVIGIRPVYAKLTAFAVSSFIVGVAGALWGFVYLGSWEPAAFSIDRSFQLLFMIIIGGLGSIMGSFFGAAFIVVLPIVLDQALPALGRRVRPARRHGDRVACGADDLRRADRVLPHRRAARPGAAVVDRQGEAAAVAVPALMFAGHPAPSRCSFHPRRQTS